MTGFLAGAGAALLLTWAIQSFARSWRHASTITAQPPATTTPTPPPRQDTIHLPGTVPPPMHTHGGLTRRIYFFSCGCAHTLDRHGNLTHVARHQPDSSFNIAEWERRLTQ